MDFQPIVELAPVPIFVYQDGRVVYSNAAGYELMEYFGTARRGDALDGFDPMANLVPEERADALRDAQRVIEHGETLRNQPRTLRDAQGRRLACLISGAPVPWDARPALLVSVVILGLAPLQSSEGAPAPAPAPTPLRDARGEVLDRLTPRERQVALRLAEGQTVADLGARLGIRESTLRGYIKAVYRKLGVHSRSELARRLIGQR